MMTRTLAGKTALVTGAARRIGAAVALALAREGANVIIHYKTSVRDAAHIADAAVASGSRAWTLYADLEQPAEAEGLMRRALSVAGSVEILVNSAGIFPADTILTFTPERLLQNINVNALAPALLGRCFAQQQRRGVIINMLDTRIVDYDREHAAYSLSKRLLFTLTRMMALEFAPEIRVNGVAPGLILPPEGQDMQYLERLASTHPLHAHGAPEDVTEAVLFLVRSDFVTGQIIFVDGGRHLRGNTYGC